MTHNKIENIFAQWILFFDVQNIVNSLFEIPQIIVNLDRSDAAKIMFLSEAADKWWVNEYLIHL